VEIILVAICDDSVHRILGVDVDEAVWTLQGQRSRQSSYTQLAVGHVLVSAANVSQPNSIGIHQDSGSKCRVGEAGEVTNDRLGRAWVVRKLVEAE
jgi:hypothetical protein